MANIKYICPNDAMPDITGLRKGAENVRHFLHSFGMLMHFSLPFEPSGKHVRVTNTPLNPTGIQQNWVYLIFLFLVHNKDCGYSFRGGSNV